MRFNRTFLTATGAATLAFVAACTPAADDTAADATTEATGEVTDAETTMLPAVAQLMSADGKPMGEATLTEVAGGLQLALTGMDLPEGVHGVHIHTTGKCEGPKFETAGGHWNPAAKQHGLENPAGSHGGDLPNFTVGSDGKGSLSAMLADARLTAGDNPLLDADGAAFVIHAKPDDQVTDPSGDSGDRIACGVFAPGAVEG